MGCHNCTPCRGGDAMKTTRKKNKLHPIDNSRQFKNDIPLPTPLTRDSLDKLYKKVLQPYQSRIIPLSRPSTSASDPSLHDRSLMSKETSSRVQSEIKLVAESLPVSLGNSIFIFVNENDPQTLKAFVAGPANTPYAHGLFEFDITVQDCPGSQLKIQFNTNGHHKMNFGAGLPASGSIDMTNVHPLTSDQQTATIGSLNIGQLLLSLQNLFRVEGIGARSESGSSESTAEMNHEHNREYKAYCNVIKYATIKYAMLAHLKHPPQGLRDFVQTYFCLKKDVIVKEIKRWIAEAQLDNGDYDGMVAKIHPELATDLRNGAYFVRLNKLFQKLEAKMTGTRVNEDSAIMESFRRERKTLKEGSLSIITL